MRETLENTYTIRLCYKHELDDLLDFIKHYWKENHIFNKSISLFNWQHLGESHVNFVMAKDNETGRLLGVLGFIPTYQYDENLKDKKDMWGAIWKITNDAPSGLGLKIMQFFYAEINPISYGAIGNTPIALSLYKLIKLKTGNLNQYFLFSNSSEQYDIAKTGNLDKNDKDIHQMDEMVIKEINLSSDILLPHLHCPQKSLAYLINRYQNHPIYKYIFFGVYDDNVIKAILIIRKQFAGASSCLRIVDIYGNINAIGCLYRQLQDLMKKEGSEYIDCYNHGISETVFSRIGLKKLDPNGETIIPNYFEPFEQRNVIINFAVKTLYPDYVIFKGDGDQDRPSIIKEDYE